MKKTIVVALLLGTPLAAQSWEVGAFVGQQSYNSFTVSTVELKPENKVIGAVRGGYSIVDLGPALFQINASFQPKASTDVKANGTVFGVKLDHQATSLGLAFIFKAGVSASVGLDYRWDKMDGSFQGAAASTTYGRPWARANIGFAIPSPVVKPFVGLEVAGALSSKSVGALGPSTDEEAMKALAPKLQIGLYAGVRF
jgi:hypothetical protein